jgi:hypothetical protein
MKFIGKSLLLAFVGTGLFFFFLMMAVIPIQALMARIGGNVAKTSVVVNPALFLRTAGVPMAAAAFVLFFGISLYRFHRMEKQALTTPR